MNSDHFHKLENMYHTAPINQIFKPRINIKEKRAEVTMEIKEHYFHAAHALHGAVYFKMLDDAAFFAVNSIIKDFFVLTTDFNIHLLRPVSKGILKSVGELRFSSSTLFVAESTLYTEEGKELAIGRGSFLKSRMALSEQMGYT